MNHKSDLRLSFIVGIATTVFVSLCSLMAAEDSRRLSLVKATLPTYPRLAKIAGIQATLDVEMVVNKMGRVTDIRRTGRTSKPADILWEHVEELVRREWIFDVEGDAASNIVRAQFVFDLLPAPRDQGGCLQPQVDIQLLPFIRIVLTDYQPRPVP